MSLRYTFAIIFLAIIISVIAVKEPFTTKYLSSHALAVLHTEATSTPAESGPVSIIAVGDIMLGRHVESLMGQYGDSYPFDHIDDFLKQADAVVANLEGPVLQNHIQTPSQDMHFSFDPRMPSVLPLHNIKIVNLANNHTYDFGTGGFAETAGFLDKAGVLHAGNPYIVSDAYVLRTTIKNKKFIFLGFNVTNPNFDQKAAHAFVQNLKKDPDEYLIAMCHGGEEYRLTSDANQQNFYRGLIDDGVDLVIGHHPHVVEEVEQYKNKMIFYSLGNFVFDQYFSNDVQQELAVKITFDKDSITYDLVPMKSVASQPWPMRDTDSQEFLGTLADKSSANVASSVRVGEIVR